MRNLIVIVVAAFAALTASAVQSFSIVNTAAYGKDANPSDANAGYYSGYLCTVESATKYLGGKTSAADLTDYVSANYAAVMSGLSAASAADGVLKLSADAEGYAAGQYAVSAYSATALGGEYLALVMYADGENEAFRAFGYGSGVKEGGGVVFDDMSASAGTVGNWNSVPEPTSALLVLLGLAGLALRRQRA